MAEQLKPPFEEEFPDNGQAWPEDIQRRYELGQINAREADQASQPLTPSPLAETQPSNPLPKQNQGRKYGSFILKKDGTPDGRHMSPAERRAQERLPEDQWHLR